MSTAHLYVPKAQYEAKVAELQAQVAQLKEDRDTWMGQAKRANLQVAQCLETVAQLTEANRELSTTIQTLRNELAGKEPETINPYGRGMVQVDPGRP